MLRPKIKICGVTTPDAFDAVVEAGADYVGLNFFPPSPRAITAAAAAALSGRHAGGPARVGLFVEPELAAIEAVLAHVRLDYLQIYAGDAAIRAIRARFGLPVWQGLGVATSADLPGESAAADGFVIEAKPPPDATRPGGNALRADWGLLGGWHTSAFWLLAGGLTPANVAAAIAQSKAAGVDVSSGVETAPGVKSPELIKKFVKEALFFVNK